MIAADSSTFVAYLAGESGPDIEALDQALSSHGLCVPPVVVTELMSARRRPPELDAVLANLPLLAPMDGYWQRAGLTRANLIARGLRPPLADALICQSCLDYDVALITRDADFGSFARHCGLRLI